MYVFYVFLSMDTVIINLPIFEIPFDTLNNVILIA